MSIAIDGFAALRAIGKHRDAFPDISDAAAKAALALIDKQIKARKLNVTRLRGVREAVGAAAFGTVLDDLNEKEVAALLGKVDKHWPELKTAAADAQRSQLYALAEERAEPTSKPKGAGKGKAKRSAETASDAAPIFKDTLGSKAMRARRAK